jgi:16S rRNA (adenine1518-N6/adenine1519-N6)-dimethyltransferase
MNDLTDLNSIKALLARHGFRFSKTLGQNFLCAAWVPERIADEAGLDGDTGVLEVGPGIGCLTAELARRARRVVSVELDKALQPVLAETLAGLDNVEVVFADVMKTDLSALCAEKFADCAHVVVCANLPYQITTPVLTAFAETACLERVTVMIQREVARRICAAANTADYGAFTLLMQWHFETETLFDVPPGCFIPAPKVTSSVVRLTRRPAPPVAVKSEERFFAVVRAAFNQRRKTLCNALAAGLGLPKETVAAAITAAGLPESIRGEALDMAQFAQLADILY